ncbi:MAG: hypothetical protein WDN25_23090 [Acetobacteraceae bacterium]
MQGSSAAEFLQGSTYDNLFQPGAGGDTIAGGPGQDEIQGSGTDLSGDTVLAWDLGDSLDITDMAVAGAVADYDPTSGVLSVSNVFSGATVDVMLPAGLAFDFQLAARCRRRRHAGDGVLLRQRHAVAHAGRRRGGGGSGGRRHAARRHRGGPHTSPDPLDRPPQRRYQPPSAAAGGAAGADRRPQHSAGTCRNGRWCCHPTMRCTSMAR